MEQEEEQDSREISTDLEEEQDNEQNKDEPEEFANAGSPLDKKVQRSISEDFICPCCYEILIDPTTLNCGHNFCRHCIASWFLSSKRQECPQCRQEWTGKPQVNRTLRSMIETLRSEHMNMRLNSMDTAHVRKVVDQFEAHLASSTSPGRIPSSLYNPVKQILSNATIYLVILVLQYFAGSLWSDPISQKPITKWTVDDVSKWLVSDVGAWTERELVPRFREQKIDGWLLVAMTEDDIETLVDATDLQRRGFRMALSVAQDLGVKAPSNLWEYKNMYLGRSVFLMSVVWLQPRMTLIYLLLFEYNTVFLPIIHTSAPVYEDIADINLYIAKLPSPRVSQWVILGVKAIFCPCLIVIEFSRRMKEWFSWLFILASFLWFSYTDAMWLKGLLANRRNWLLYSMQALKNFVPSLFVLVFWPILPTFLINLGFNFMFYVLPLTYLVAMYYHALAFVAR